MKTAHLTPGGYKERTGKNGEGGVVHKTVTFAEGHGFMRQDPPALFPVRSWDPCRGQVRFPESGGTEQVKRHDTGYFLSRLNHYTPLIFL
ncbi:hypothetical protein AGMMS49587_11660 [Spirochaetia bacterium]|nr:hypothetical protein AGMMS49587_11660 [Spirochaetia bacterium]